MNISFNLNDTKAPSTIKYLKPYNIYDDVEIESMEIKSGTSKNGNEWKCVRVNFTCPEGVHSESIFVPGANGTERKEYDTQNGGKRVLPSQHEVFMQTIATYASAFNPEGFKKMQAASTKFQSYDDICKAFVQILKDKTKNQKTSMKLIGRNNDGRIYARLPECLGIKQNEKGEWVTFPVSVFGSNLSFSSYEMNQKNRLENTKKTEMKDESSELNAGLDSADDIDFDELLK